MWQFIFGILLGSCTTLLITGYYYIFKSEDDLDFMEFEAETEK